jgi:hypothetical protein
VHSTQARNTLCLDKVLGEMKVRLDGKEWDLDLHEVVLVEAQSQDLNPRDNYEELMELTELQRCLEGAEVEHVTEAGWLAILVWDISMVLVNLGMPPILMIPHDPCMAGDSWRLQTPSWIACGKPTPSAMIPGTRCRSFSYHRVLRPSCFYFCLCCFLF